MTLVATPTSHITPTPSAQSVYPIYKSIESVSGNDVPFFDNFSTPLDETLDQLAKLKTWERGWNGYDVDAPNLESIRAAELWIKKMYNDVFFSLKSWQSPHITASEDGEVLFEWWHGDKGLSVYIESSSRTYFIKDWGPDIVSQMEDGEANSSNIRRNLWSWLVA